jgi:hypothetical protein
VAQAVKAKQQLVQHAVVGQLQGPETMQGGCTRRVVREGIPEEGVPARRNRSPQLTVGPGRRHAQQQERQFTVLSWKTAWGRGRVVSLPVVSTVL